MRKAKLFQKFFMASVYLLYILKHLFRFIYKYILNCFIKHFLPFNIIVTPTHAHNIQTKCESLNYERKLIKRNVIIISTLEYGYSVCFSIYLLKIKFKKLVYDFTNLTWSIGSKRELNEGVRRSACIMGLTAGLSHNAITVWTVRNVEVCRLQNP